MSHRPRNVIDELRGASRLAIQATVSIVDVVEAMQHAIGGGPDLLGRPLLGPTRLFSAPVYGGVRGVTRLVGAVIDGALAVVAPVIAPFDSAALRSGRAGRAVGSLDTAVAVLNGVLGDYLVDSGSPLAIEMALLHQGTPLVLDRRALRTSVPDAARKLLVLVHGSCRHARQWTRAGADPMGVLARDLGYSPIQLQYNTGLHVSTNGRALSALLEQLVATWPVPVDELALVGHSMGGLVARSACHVGEAEGHAWRRRLRRLVCICSPHHGAPLERGGHWIDVLLEVSRYSAPLARLGKIRSAGVTDLRFGNVLEEHRDRRGRFAHGPDLRRSLRLPAGVQCYAMAATKTPAPGTGKYASDGLVPVDSALGRHRNPALTLAFDETWIGFGMGHLDLLGRPEAYEVLRTWLRPTCRDT